MGMRSDKSETTTKNTEPGEAYQKNQREANQEETVKEERGGEVTSERRMVWVEEVKYVCDSDGKNESCTERERGKK